VQGGKEAMMYSKFGFAAKLFSKAIGVSLAVMLSLSLANVATVKAEQSDEMREFLKKQKLKRNGLLGVYAPSSHDAAPTPSGKATTETEVFSTQVVEPMLSVGGAAEMQAAESKYAAIVSNGGWPKVPKGAYKKGSNSKGVIELNQRLFIEGYVRQEATEGEFASIFTSATEDALMRFQRNHGLAVSGQVDGPTLQALNVSADERLSTIRANIPRIAEYSKDLGDRYIVVNVPAQQIETVEGNRVFSRHNAIVGRPARPTPVVMTAVSEIKFNPYWNAPASIVERDIIPKIMGGNTSILQKMNMKVFEGVGGPEVNPRRINWRRAVVDNYHFRQEPGGENAMATAKINFSSPFGIYLHDTPEQHLFESSGRFYSSGCVRVQKVAILLNWILNGQDGFDPNRIANLAQSLERLDVTLVAPPQLRVAYLTAWPTSSEIVAFRGDVYGLDGTGFIVGQPLPVGEKTASGERFVLKPVPRQVASLDEAEADSFFWFGRRSARNVDDDSSKSKIKKTRSAGLFNWNGDDAKISKKKVVKKIAAVPKKKTTVADSKKTPLKATTKVASTTTKKVVKPEAPAAKKTEDLCKPDKDGKLPKDCKIEAVAKPISKPVEKPEATASATN
jgi:murein L,D-transpeptidase YcbB/YkuD